MRDRLFLFALRRIMRALALVLVVASAATLLARLAPGDHLSSFDVNASIIAAERQRLGLDQPLWRQYLAWVSRVARLDWGESTAHAGRSVSSLIAERAPHSVIIGLVSLIVATAVGIPVGILTGSRRHGVIWAAARVLAIFCLALPPIALSLGLLVVASQTGWFPVGGPPHAESPFAAAQYVVLPVVALTVPIAAALERLQSRAIADALSDPSILAARARGLSENRVVWRHAFRLSLKPVLAVYGIMIGALISGSFVVEYVMTWPGLGQLMYEALRYRDANLVAGCAATGAAFLAAGILVSDLLLAVVDPRLEVG